MCLCVHTRVHKLRGHKRVGARPPQACLPSAHTQAHTSPAGPSASLDRTPGPRCLLSRAVFLPAAAQRADVGGESTGTSINHSQLLLQRLQELLRQGNASDVVLRVQAAGTDEVRVFHAHRLLLGLHSELFRELLSNQSEAVLQEPRDCAAVFDKFIRCGRVRGETSPLSKALASRPLSGHDVHPSPGGHGDDSAATPCIPSPSALLQNAA